MERSQSIPSTARNKIEHASDTQLVWEPSYSRPPVGKGGKRKVEADADAVKGGLRAVTMDAMLHDTELAFKAAGKYGVSYGYYVLEGPYMTFDDRPEKPVEKDFKGKYAKDDYEWALIDYENSLREWNPIRIRAPHPGTVLLDPSERQPTVAIRQDSLYRRDIVRMLQALHERDRKPEQVLSKAEIERWLKMDDWEMVEIAEYFTPKEHSMTFNEVPLFSETNAYGFVQFNHGFAGFGMRKTSDNKNDPLYLAQGLLEPVLDSLKTDAQAASAKHNALMEYSYMRPTTTGDGAELAEQLADPNAIIETNGAKVGFLQYPEMARAFFQTGIDAKDDIEAGTYFNVVSGGRTVGVNTVGQHAMQSTTALKKFAALNVQLNMSATVIARNTLRLVDRYGEPIHVGGEVLDPKQIHHDYTIRAAFQAFDPILQQQEREIGLREQAQGIISNQTYRETALRIRDETEELIRLMKEEVRGSDAYKAAIARQVAEEDGMLEAMERARAEEQGQGGPQAGGVMPQPEISAEAGGGATRALRQPLTGDVANPPRTPLPPENVQ